MKNFPTARTLALLSAGLAAVALAACNKNSSSQNGAYVAASTDSSQSTGSQPLPPSNAYQAVASTPPPEMPVYDQPPIPAPGYVWTPGYWDWNENASDYYWVPGTWIEPPATGYLWTPGYWRFYNGRYLFSDGYWGPQVGFYGGVDYGYGYDGTGYSGGRWQGSQFYYNSQANNFGGRQIGATYRQDLSTNSGRVSFNGGPGGLHATPARTEIAAALARHAPPTASQREQARAAADEPQLRASTNRGRPPIAATSRPAAYHDAGVTGARSAANYTPPATSGAPPQAARPGVDGSPKPGRPGPATDRPAAAERAAPVERPATAVAVARRPYEAPSEQTRGGTPSRPVQGSREGPPRGPMTQVHAPQGRDPAPRAADHPAAPHEQAAPDRPR